MLGGTLPYMAPEQIEAFLNPDLWGKVGARADIYSLGLVLRELLTGQAPDLPDEKLPPARAMRDLLDRRARLDDRPPAVEPGDSPRSRSDRPSAAFASIPMSVIPTPSPWPTIWSDSSPASPYGWPSTPPGANDSETGSIATAARLVQQHGLPRP